ncbi:MAG: hypothetical protein ACK5YX_15320, partial [Planctomyces sp.]
MSVMRYGLLFGACFLSLWGCQAPVAGQEIPERFESVSEAPLLAGRPGEWDARIRERGWILREGGEWKLWYTGYDPDRQPVRMSLG